MAYHGWGVWSLVNMYITNGILSLLILWIISKWKPSLSFSFNSIKNLFSFGGYLMSASILQQISQNIQGIIIGKRFSASDMGYFSQADKLNSVVSSSIPNIITQVMYPVFSNIQDDRDRLQQMLLINLRIISFIIFPLMGVLIIIAQPLIVGLYGEKWLPSVPIFQILCVSGFFICLQNINFYAVAAVGASKALFNWSFYKWGFLLAAILIGMIWGLYGIIWGMVLSSLNIFLVNAYLASKKADVPFNLQLLSILPSAGIIMISMIIGFFLLFIQINPWFVGIVTILCYFLFSFIFKLKAIKETQYFLKSLLKKV